MVFVQDPSINAFLNTTRGIVASTALSSSSLHIFLGILISLPVLKMLEKYLGAVLMALALLRSSTTGKRLVEQ